MTQINVLRDPLGPPTPTFTLRDLLVILGVWFLVMGAAGTLFFVR